MWFVLSASLSSGSSFCRCAESLLVLYFPLTVLVVWLRRPYLDAPTFPSSFCRSAACIFLPLLWCLADAQSRLLWVETVRSDTAGKWWRNWRCFLTPLVCKKKSFPSRSEERALLWAALQKTHSANARSPCQSHSVGKASVHFSSVFAKRKFP